MKAGVTVALLASALAVWAVPFSAGADACKPGRRVIGKVVLVVHCGPARATVTAGGVRYRIFGGTCTKPRGTGLYVVEVGILTAPGSRPTARYLGIRSKRLRDGVEKGASVAVQAGRRSYTLAPNVVRIAGGMTRGSFSGDALGPQGRVSGTWRC